MKRSWCSLYCAILCLASRALLVEQTFSFRLWRILFPLEEIPRWPIFFLFLEHFLAETFDVESPADATTL